MSIVKGRLYSNGHGSSLTMNSSDTTHELKPFHRLQCAVGVHFAGFHLQAPRAPGDGAELLYVR